jgi:carboxypeptidase D
MVPFVKSRSQIFNFNSTYMDYLETNAADAIQYYDEHINQFPPAGPFPPVPANATAFDVSDSVLTAATYINPCYNPYHITDTCPFPWDQMQLYGLAAGPSDFFNSTAVQTALHVPPKDFSVCNAGSPGLLYNDTLPDSAFGPLPGVIERTNNVIITHGEMSMVGLADGSLLCIQNMTWGGKQGFQTPMPADLNLFMPYHRGLDEIVAGTAPIPMTHTAGAGLLGKWHSERGVTFARVSTGGHSGLSFHSPILLGDSSHRTKLLMTFRHAVEPQFNPGVSYRLLELLLGRIPSLNYTGYYTGLVEEP